VPTGYQPPQNYGGPPPGNGYGGGQAPYGGQQVSSLALQSQLADTGSHGSCLLQTEMKLKTECKYCLFRMPFMQAQALVLTLRFTDVRDKGRSDARQIMIVLYGST